MLARSSALRRIAHRVQDVTFSGGVVGPGQPAPLKMHFRGCGMHRASRLGQPGRGATDRGRIVYHGKVGNAKPRAQGMVTYRADDIPGALGTAIRADSY